MQQYDPSDLFPRQATQTEHALTRDKMKELMSKLRREKSFRRCQVYNMRASTTPGSQWRDTPKIINLCGKARGWFRRQLVEKLLKSCPM